LAKKISQTEVKNF